MTIVPRGLAARLIVILLVVVTLAQIAGALLLIHDKNTALRSMLRSQITVQAIAIRNVMMRTPFSGRAALADSVSLPNLCATVTAQPEAPQAADATELDFVERLSSIMAGQLEQRPRVTILQSPQMLSDSPALPPCLVYEGRMSLPHPGASARHHNMAGVIISLPLEDGTWLNTFAAVFLPDLGDVATWPSLLLLAVAVAVASAVTIRVGIQPLQRLAAAAERLGRGETVEAIPETGPSEIVLVISAFNLMRERLTRFIDDRTRLLAAISHDLRTPLTTLRLRASLMDDADMGAQITATVEEMQAMVEATLSFTRSAASEGSRVIDVASLVQSVVDDLVDLGADVVMTGGERLDLACRPLAVKRAVRNLMENAVRYGHRARVALVRQSGALHIRIDDDGPGIPEDRLDEVVKPFVRLEESRSADTGGIGLGLAIARNVAHAHGGDLVLANRAEGGLRADLVLPLGHGRSGS